MAWDIEYIKEAVRDLNALDHTQQIQVLKAIKKVCQNPLPASEGGYGKLLGNHLTSKLAGYFKIKLKSSGLRMVYSLVRQDGIMRVIIISIRDNDTVYKMAEKRIHTNPQLKS